jgi:kinesin family protein 18/19
MSEEANMLVAIRIRPLNPKELASNDKDITRVEDKLLIILDMNDFEERKNLLHRSREQRYVFDKIFKEATNEHEFSSTVQDLVHPALSGINACVFAYGPTGSGKTYTMLGGQEDPGIAILTIREMFKQIQASPDKLYDIKISYVEIYNEAIRDLLNPSNNYLDLRDDPLRGVVIAGVTEFSAESTEQVMNLLSTGNKRRTTEATNANQTSSRSHAIFQVSLAQRDRIQSTEVDIYQGKLSLIDLAGSERGTVTENRGIRLLEGAKINRSLLALANCINALGDKSKKGFFVPYRDSKLTRMLKDSLGGNCKTVMISNISPAASQFEESVNTLKYASRAKNIKYKVQANKKLVSLHIAEYKNIISDLRSEIEQLKVQLTKGITSPAESDCKCSCGRLHDDLEMKKIQADIFENFQERIQLRRALLELEEQNALNILEIKRRQAEVVIWKKEEENKELPKYEEGRPLSAVPSHIRKEFKDIQLLKGSTDKNNKRKELMIVQLQENMARGKAIRMSIDSRIKFQEKRDFLELLIKSHILEQTNVELELQLLIQEKTISDLQSLIIAQKKLLEERGIDDGSSIWAQVDEIVRPMEKGMEEEVTEEELQMKGYDINAPIDEDEEIPFDKDDEDFETSEMLLATSKVSADIDGSEDRGFMLKGKALIKKQEQEVKVKNDPAPVKVENVPAGMGLMINGKIIEDGLSKGVSVTKQPKQPKKVAGVRKKK